MKPESRCSSGTPDALEAQVRHFVNGELVSYMDFSEHIDGTFSEFTLTVTADPGGSVLTPTN